MVAERGAILAIVEQTDGALFLVLDSLSDHFNVLVFGYSGVGMLVYMRC